MLKTTCDAAGNFEFDNIPDGEYFLATTVIWESIGYGGSLKRQGGILMEKVTVRNGEIKKIILTY